jgi:hypothetical protein
MLVYLLVFAFQSLFNIFKTLEIKYTYQQKVRALLANSVWINLVSLGSTYFSIQRLFAGDWLIVLIYIAGSIFGKWVAMTKIDTYKRKIHRLYLKLKNN